MKRLLPVALVLALVGCDDGSPEPDAGSPEPDAGSTPLLLGDVDVTVTADLPSFEGRVQVGAFRNMVPIAPPLAIARETDPTFPLEVRLRGLEPGTYWIVGIVDYDPPSATLPGSEDYTSTAPEPVVVMGDDLQTAALEFDIPDP